MQAKKKTLGEHENSNQVHFYVHATFLLCGDGAASTIQGTGWNGWWGTSGAIEKQRLAALSCRELFHSNITTTPSKSLTQNASWEAASCLLPPACLSDITRIVYAHMHSTQVPFAPDCNTVPIREQCHLEDDVNSHTCQSVNDPTRNPVSIVCKRTSQLLRQQRGLFEQAGSSTNRCFNVRVRTLARDWTVEPSPAFSAK